MLLLLDITYFEMSTIQIESGLDSIETYAIKATMKLYLIELNLNWIFYDLFKEPSDNKIWYLTTYAWRELGFVSLNFYEDTGRWISFHNMLYDHPFKNNYLLIILKVVRDNALLQKKKNLV